MANTVPHTSCSLDCEHNFHQCMLYALDGFLMGACIEQLEECEKECKSPNATNND